VILRHGKHNDTVFGSISAYIWCFVYGDVILYMFGWHANRFKALREERNALLEYVLDINKDHVILPDDATTPLDYDSISVLDLLKSLKSGIWSHSCIYH
jgi:hypothetical protein